MSRQIGIFTKHGFKPNYLFKTLPDFWQQEILDLMQHGITFVAPCQVHIDDPLPKQQDEHLHQTQRIVFVDAYHQGRTNDCPYYTLPTVRKIPLHKGDSPTTYLTPISQRAAHDHMIDVNIALAKSQASE